MTNEELLACATELGTPTYVFDTQTFGARLDAVREIWGPKVDLCYSIKANPFLVPTALAHGYALEVCSPGELAICERDGVDPARIVYSGVCKQAKDVREALRFGAGTFTAESLGQLALVDAEAAAAGVRVPTLLRLNGGSQFGMSREDLVHAVDHRDELAGCELVGIHYFVGTQRAKLKWQQRELAMLAELIDELRRDHGWRAQRLEYGPGLAVPLFEGQDFSDTLAPARDIAPGLAAIADRVELQVEMGRFLATECGYYLARVVDEKDNEDTSYAFIDGGMNHVTYFGQMMGMKEPCIRNLSHDERVRAGEATGEARDWALCGSLCTTADVLVRKAPFADLRVGDLLAFENIGAYSVPEGIYLFLSRTMPAVALRDGRGVRVVREPMETWQNNCC